ncbi:MAG: DUF2125 domain-containing protein [Alphaproteobacteria bacterium]
MKVSRVWLASAWGAFLLIATIWVGYWNVTANAARQSVANWIAAERHAGADARIGAISTRGFPVLLRLEMADVQYASRGRTWTAQMQRLDININLINPQHVIFEARAPIMIGAGGANTTISARNLLLSLRANRGALVEARLEADDLALERQGAEVVRMQKLMAGLRPDPRAAADDQLAIQTTALHLAQPVRGFEPLGQDIASANAAIVLENAAGLFETGDPLGNWTAHAGRARVEGWGVTWGPLDADGKGVITLDAQHRLQGALDIDAPHPAPALRALARSPTLSRDAKDALDALALGFSLGHRSAHAHLAAADGVLTLERVPVRTLAPVY